jgi:hypothetical protein
MRSFLVVLLISGCASVKDESHSPERKADYAECEKNTPSGTSLVLFGGIAQAMQINDCMKAKGWD